MRSQLVLAVLVLASCGGGTAQIEIAAPPDRVTIGTLAGPLCVGDHCTCRDPGSPGDGGAGMATEGRKRFEIRIGPASNELWVTVQGNVLYKSAETAEACFYIDLAPGEHPVALRASKKEGYSAAVTIHELGAKTGSWYDTFKFNCGSPGVCSFDELESEKERIHAIPKAIHDRCGSVRIKALHWDTGRAPDQAHPAELALSFKLDIEKWPPFKKHGDDTCGGPPPKDGTPTGGDTGSLDPTPAP